MYTRPTFYTYTDHDLLSLYITHQCFVLCLGIQCTYKDICLDNVDTCMKRTHVYTHVWNCTHV